MVIFSSVTPGAFAQAGADTSQLSPYVLPGKGLAEHDFLYAGEGKRERMFIVRGGKVVWSYDSPAKGEISDAMMLSNGNILFAHQFGVTEIAPDKTVLWNYDAPTNTEIHTAQAIGKDRVLFIQNGNPALLAVVNLATGRLERKFELQTGNPKSVHGQFRHARLTRAGTLLVAHKDMDEVREYDESGKVIWSLPTPGVWSAVPLTNGNVLLTGNVMLINNKGPKYVREVTHKGKTVWEWTTAEAPDYKLSRLQLAARLPNGDTIVNNWFNEWSDKLDPLNLPVQLIEVTRDKKVVWALREWGGEVNLGPSTIIQILDEPSAPENVFFGDLR